MDSPSEESRVAELIEELRSRPATLGTGRLLCIDGPAGSGKTTLASRVAALTSATVVHLDDLYEGWSGLARVGEQLDTLLLPLAEGRPGSYRRYDWHAGRFAETVMVEPGELLVVEGVGAGLRSYRPLRTLLVWVEACDELRLARWRARDGVLVEPYIDGWERDQAALFAGEGVREAADVRWPAVR
jgi:uridine kinase